MPRRSKGPRLYFRAAGKGREAVWVIRDGTAWHSTGLAAGADRQSLDGALADYLNSKRLPRARDRHPDTIEVAAVLAIYVEDVVPRNSRPREAAKRVAKLGEFFGDRKLGEINEALCTSYVAWRGAQINPTKKGLFIPENIPAARRELEDLRAAIRHHWKQGLCSGLTPVVLPARGSPRERWLTRSEAARLLRAMRGKRHRHVARFVLVGLYTGTRAGAICGAALEPTPGRGWIDLERGVFYRRAQGARETNKRQPAIRIPPRLLAHIRRWARLGIARRAVVEWRHKAVRRINKAFRSARAAAGLGVDVVPHTLRHTAITWQAQLGVPEHEICGFFGVTREVFERVYGHHHPDHQASAVNALSRPRTQLAHRMGVNETRRNATNVVRMR